MYNTFNVHKFTTLEEAKFSPDLYSKLKFGSDHAAKVIGYELATEFFRSHSDLILANHCVVFASPYNYVKNAATLMTEHFINKLNDLLVTASGKHVDYSLIHRKVSYTADYGFLSKEKRKGLIDNDEFYLNKDYIKDKLLIVLDDIRITGTHEERLIDELKKHNVPNEAIFLYYAKYFGNSPDIEGALNFYWLKSIDNLLELSNEHGHHTIIRPIKYVLSYKNLAHVLEKFSDKFIESVYYGCLAEGYYKIPGYQENFALISKEKQKRNL